MEQDWEAIAGQMKAVGAGMLLKEMCQSREDAKAGRIKQNEYANDNANSRGKLGILIYNLATEKMGIKLALPPDTD